MTEEERQELNELKDGLKKLLGDANEAWRDRGEEVKEAEKGVLNLFRDVIDDAPFTFEDLEKMATNEEEKQGFIIFASTIAKEITKNFFFFEMAGGKERLFSYINTFVSRLRNLELENRLLMETISIIERERDGKN